MADIPRDIYRTRRNRKQLEWSWPPFLQDCGMDTDSGELLQGRTKSDSMFKFFFFFLVKKFFLSPKIVF